MSDFTTIGKGSRGSAASDDYFKVTKYDGTNAKAVMECFQDVAAGRGWLELFLGYDGKPPKAKSEQEKKEEQAEALAGMGMEEGRA